jgi:hypothetical protein
MAEFNKRPGKTTTGLVWRDTAKDTLDSRYALLYDFDIDDWELKQNHEAWILDGVSFMADDIAARKKGVLPKWATSGPQWKVWIDGYASKTGEFSHNVLLSSNREQAVEKEFRKRIKARGLTDDDIAYDMKFHGFKDTSVKGEHEEGRAVYIVIQRPGLPPPPVIAKPPPPPPTSKKFKICVLGDIMGAKVFALETSFFQIVDTDNSLTAFFLFTGWGTSVPVPITPPASLTMKGDDTYFETTKPVELKDFEGNASYGQGPSIGKWSLFPALLAINGSGFLSKGVSIKPPHTLGIQIVTGKTIGVNIFSSTEGKMEMKPKEVLPYKKP